MEIYYEEREDVKNEDMILMQVSESWSLNDYLHYYCTHKYPEYLKLREFMKKNELPLGIALNILIGGRQSRYNEFRHGKFEFSTEVVENDFEIAWQTVNYIKKINGNSPYTKSARFWRAFLNLIQHVDFDRKQWEKNMKKHVTKFSNLATAKDYLVFMQHIYNYRVNQKVDFLED